MHKRKGESSLDCRESEVTGYPRTNLCCGDGSRVVDEREDDEDEDSSEFLGVRALISMRFNKKARHQIEQESVFNEYANVTDDEGEENHLLVPVASRISSFSSLIAQTLPGPPILPHPSYRQMHVPVKFFLPQGRPLPPAPVFPKVNLL